MMRRTLVLGIGNTLLGDEGVGVHALRALRERACGLRSVSFVDGGTLSFILLPEIENADHLLVLDAAELEEEPGAVRLFQGPSMDGFLNGRRRHSVHEVSLLDLLAVARLTDSLPARRALIGVQPQHIEWSEFPSTPVSNAIPEVCRLAVALLRGWQGAVSMRTMA